MGKSYSKNNEILVFGYVRRHETKYYIPTSVSWLILRYYPDCNVYGIGRNGLSEFGLGDFKQLHKYELLIHMTSHCDTVSDIHVGDHRFVVKNIHGELYCAGKNRNADTGTNGPDILKSLEKIKNIHATIDQYITVISSGLCARHTFVAFNDNTIYAFGWNQYGQFGNGKQNAYSRIWKTKLNNEWRINMIACGHRHSLFLTTYGNVYCSGANDLKQCGIKISNYNLNCILEMVPIAELFDIIGIACGANHSLCLNKNGKVFCFGSNDYGQLGFMDDDFNHNLKIQTPIIQDTLDANKSKIDIIRCGKNHSLFIDVGKQNAYLCGNNLNGQIGNNKKDISNVPVPYLFTYKQYTNNIIDGACGNKHTVLMTTFRNELITFGCNVYHQCSPTSNQEYTFEPYCLTAKEIGIKNKNEIISRVICGNDTTIVATHLN
eukprot:527841_1